MLQLIPARNPWPHDPSGQPLDYSLPLPGIAATDTLIAALVAPIDIETDEVLEETPVSPYTELTIYNVSFALVGSVWWVTFWASGGSPGMYTLRCRWTLSDGRGSDTYGRLQCGN